jgi:hypothetical protein
MIKTGFRCRSQQGPGARKRIPCGLALKWAIFAKVLRWEEARKIQPMGYFHWATWHHIPENGILCGYYYENMYSKIVTEMFGFYLKTYDKYKPIWCTWSGGSPQIHLTRPEHVEVIFLASDRTECCSSVFITHSATFVQFIDGCAAVI